jgi:hypothetical protein
MSRSTRTIDNILLRLAELIGDVAVRHFCVTFLLAIGV